jgi:hypothetical protein
MKPLSVPHIPHEDIVRAEDVSGRRAFGTTNELEAVQDLVNEKLNIMADKHDQTLEYLKWGALKGLVVDGDGATELANLFTLFGVTQEVQNFALTTTTTEVNAKINALLRYMELNAFGASISGVMVFCSSGFFDSLTTHASVKDAYKYYSSVQDPLRTDVRRRFVHQGVVFEEQVGSVSTPAGTVVFVPANEAIAVPIGANCFETYFAPADFIETVNTPGLPRYAKQELLEFGRGVKIHTQSNPLPICNRPQLLVRLTRS